MLRAFLASVLNFVLQQIDRAHLIFITLEGAERMGRDAALQGKHLEGNPFRPGSTRAARWASGIRWVQHHKAHTW